MLLFVLLGCYLCCSMYYLCVNVYCRRVTTQLQLINNYKYNINIIKLYFLFSVVQSLVLLPCGFILHNANCVKPSYVPWQLFK
jgi:hypothetical protein